ncbi:MAG: peptidylprolyl isomerase, partial [Erythrobacter sp.]|nr:peptidylprolyl isomerase [Erythrobacter sp.]
MTEITRVPIKPVAKGSLTKLWIGVVLAIAVGAGLAWAAVPRGVDVDTQVAGTGAMPKVGDVVFLKYKGKLAADGTVFDESRDIPLPVEGIFPEGTPFPIEEGATIPGF